MKTQAGRRASSSAPARSGGAGVMPRGRCRAARAAGRAAAFAACAQRARRASRRAQARHLARRHGADETREVVLDVPAQVVDQPVESLANAASPATVSGGRSPASDACEQQRRVGRVDCTRRSGGIASSRAAATRRSPAGVTRNFERTDGAAAATASRSARLRSVRAPVRARSRSPSPPARRRSRG